MDSKRQIAIKHNIQITYELLFPESTLISAVDLSSILFNLLDNGIEACLRSNSTAPFIRLSISTNANFLTILMRNSKNDLELFNYFSSKKDAQNHGFGLSIIEDCARRNDGTCEWKDRGDSFESAVLLRYK